MSADDLRDRLISEREAARTGAEVCTAVARIEWYNSHDGAECPPNRIPALADLGEWLTDCPADAWEDAAELERAIAQPGFVAWVAMTAVMPGATDRSRPFPADWLPAVGTGCHAQWLAADEPRPRHPFAPIVAAWQRRPVAVAGATVTTTRHDRADGGMIRRPSLVSTVPRVAWRDDGNVPLVTGAVVDGEPMAAERPDTADLFPVRKRRPRRKFKPGEQATLPLPVVPPIPHDLRLLALADLAGDPAMQGDVLALLAFAWAADRPLVLNARDGAALLARGRDGKARSPHPKRDVDRFWEAAAALRALFAWDDGPGGTGAWANLATVYVSSVRPVDRVTIGPPEWAKSAGGKWTLTAEASAASIARAVSGKHGMAGRIITGIEYRLASGYTGRPGTVAPDLRAADRRRKASGGPVVTLDWRTCLRLAGDWWDEANPAADEAARDRFRRAVATLERRGYFVPGGNLSAEASAGDSVEIVGRVRGGGRGRGGGLLVRASARFVEAARLAQMPGGKGFETRRLTDWAGL